MTRTYKYGFTYKNFLFGWTEGFKELHRLKCNGTRHYSLKKVPLIDIGKAKKPKKGYRVLKDHKTKDQLIELTEIIDYEYNIIGANDKDCLF